MLNRLVGNQLHSISPSYGQQLFHFGKTVPMNHPRLKGHSLGEYILCSGGDPWKLSIKDTSIYSNSIEGVILVEKSVERIELQRDTLTLFLRGGGLAEIRGYDWTVEKRDLSAEFNNWWKDNERTLSENFQAGSWTRVYQIAREAYEAGSWKL